MNINLVEDNKHLGMVNNNNNQGSVIKRKASKKELVESAVAACGCNCKTHQTVTATFHDTWNTIGTCCKSW